MNSQSLPLTAFFLLLIVCLTLTLRVIGAVLSMLKNLLRRANRLRVERYVEHRVARLTRLP